MNARTRAMAAHPAGKALMSEDEAQACMDAEACAVASVNWRQAPEVSRRRILEVLLPSLTLIAVLTLLFVDVFVINGPVIA